jgi:hypothetical protein
MSIPKILSPFSKKFLSPQATDTGAGIDLRPRVSLNEDLNWHWANRGGAFFNALQHPAQNWAEHPEKFFQDAGDPHIVQEQPDWNLDKPLEDLPDEPLPQAEGHDMEALGAPNWRMQPLAFYRPAHFSDADHGIHLKVVGVAKVIEAIRQQYQALMTALIPQEILTLTAIYLLHSHEMCHAWIEDVCCLLDFEEGVTTDKQGRRYAMTNRHYNSYIWKEEAICNTAAYGWLTHFLKSAPVEGLATFDANAVLSSVENWMRTQPRGYNQFKCIEQAPHTSEVFILNVCRLLFQIYGAHGAITKAKIAEVVAAYFNCELQVDWSGFKPHGDAPVRTLLFGKVPLHTDNEYNLVALQGIDPAMGFHELLEVL